MIFLYLLIGAIAGFLSGLLSIGGGVVIIPALAFIFTHYDLIPSPVLMQMVIGTSLATVILTTLSSGYAHYKNEAVMWAKVQYMAPGLIFGTVFGTLIAHVLPSHAISILFGLFLFYTGFRLFKQNKKESELALPRRLVRIGAISIGALSGMLGIGGGTLLMPFLLHWELDTRRAIGTSAVCGLIIGSVGTAGYMITGLFADVHLPYSTGYIYWPAFIGITSASVIAAPFGAALVQRLDRDLLRRIFAVFLWLMAIAMLFP